MISLDRYADAKLAQLEEHGPCRALAATAREDGIWAVRGGRRLLSFACSDYLNLTWHPAVTAAAIAAVRHYGAGASRHDNGNHPLYAALEERLARLKGSAAALVFGSGYLANAGIIPTLCGSEDMILIDELAHACLWTGARLARGRVHVCRHNDVAHAEDLLATHRGRHRHALIATDGVFAMDGDLAPLDALADLAERFDAWLLVDDAHGLGVVGGGRGAVAATGTAGRVPLQMGTLSKAVGGSGGYVCASQAVIDLLVTRARTLIYATGLPPATVAGAIAALEIIAGDPDLVARPLARAQAFTRAAGLAAATSAIVPVVLGEAGAALAAQRALEADGFLVAAIRPPAVPAGTARLRVAFTAAHPEDEVLRLARCVREHMPCCAAQ